MSRGKPVLILCFVFFFGFCRACPSVCVCKWKNGKQTVECDKRDLLAIPKGIDPGTQVLNFSGNNLQTLTKEKFLRLDLIHLQRIYLSRCRISSIDDRTFKGLTNLVELDLSGNSLVSIPTEAFVDCPSLMKLTLNANPIRTLRKDAFAHLAYLNTLEIGDCDVTYIEEGAFQGLNKLEWLRLDGNKLANLRNAKALPKSLRGIELQGNVWECDCHIVDLHGWLQEFSVPHTMEPICNGPPRLAGRSVRSVPGPDLACLPDVSPTTFYLEIGEGKNVSLSCYVRAVPEAKVSWLFQGRVLQNDTVIAPGLHLIYFIEQGLEDKRSDLLIFNTNAEDNGTFVCTAENSAGVIHSNFTLRVVIKQEPSNVVVVSFSFEYLLILISAAAVFAVITLLIAIAYAIRCSTGKNATRKRKKSKIATLSNSTKDSLLPESTEEYSEPLKESTNLIVVDRHHELMMMHTTSHVTEEMFVSQALTTNQLKSPTSLKRFQQLEQNPDLINDTESVERHREGDGKEQPNRGSYGKAMENAITDFELHPNSQMESAVPGSEFRPNGREFYSLPADVHLNPIGLLGAEDTRASFYRTLPHNRAGRQSPSSRYAREAEFLPRNVHPASYEHYCPGVRYTADGYQTSGSTPEYLPSPPENYKTDSPQVACCTSAAPPALVQWPHCVPVAPMHGIGKCQHDVGVAVAFQDKNVVSKRCVGAQTESENTCSSSGSTVAKPNMQSAKPINKSVFNVKVQEVLTESPDEGYEGESGESNSNPG